MPMPLTHSGCPPAMLESPPNSSLLLRNTADSRLLYVRISEDFVMLRPFWISVEDPAKRGRPSLWQEQRIPLIERIRLARITPPEDQRAIVGNVPIRNEDRAKAKRL